MTTTSIEMLYKYNWTFLPIVFVLLHANKFPTWTSNAFTIERYSQRNYYPPTIATCSFMMTHNPLTTAHTTTSTTASHHHRTTLNNDKAGVYYLPDDDVANNDDHDDENVSTTSSTRSSTSSNNPKRLILIRHGMSTANEYMDQPGNQWGDPTFTDDPNLVDAPLSSRGVQQAQDLCRRIRHGEENDVLGSILKHHHPDNILVVTSPLTRCIQTLDIGVLPNIRKEDDNESLPTSANNDDHHNEKSIQDNTMTNTNEVNIIVQPLARERVYTASDTGRPIHILQQEYPHLDFESCFSKEEIESQIPWWYHHHVHHDQNDNNMEEDEIKNENYPIEKHQQPWKEEWRPHGDGQWYAVPGEPIEVFHQRMIELFHWMKSRKERTIILVCHWAVIRWLTGDEDVKNCQVKELWLDDRLVVKEEVKKLLLPSISSL